LQQKGERERLPGMGGYWWRRRFGIPPEYQQVRSEVERVSRVSHGLDHMRAGVRRLQPLGDPLMAVRQAALQAT
jgi:hypothetical protein